MLKIRKKIFEYFVVLLILFVLIVTAGTILYFKSFAAKKFDLGVNFSASYAEYLGLNWQKTYLAILDDLKVKNIRLAAPWNAIEPEKDLWTWAALDWQVKEAENRGVNVIMALGRRTPHWPECHDPEWLKSYTAEFVVHEQLQMVQKVVERYKDSRSIRVWQVENEPLLNVFGVCPPSDLNLLRKEISLVKTLDSRPVLVTDSGELSLWVVAANLADMFGTTMYRVTYNDWLGYFYYHLPPAFYRLKAAMVGLPMDKAIISELQAEPWSPEGVLNSSAGEQKLSMDPERLINHVNYAKRTGFSGAYLWGAEWWYWRKQIKGDDSFWRTAEGLFRE